MCLPAAIAVEHANAATAADTGWQRIAAYHSQLAALEASPAVELNRAVAIAMAGRPGRRPRSRRRDRRTRWIDTTTSTPRAPICGGASASARRQRAPTCAPPSLRGTAPNAPF